MSAPFRMPAPIDTGEAARYLHARRALEQALDHGTALLAALGLPRLVDDGFSPTDRDAAGEALTAAMALLDAIDPDPDLEPSLGAPERHPSGFALFGGTDASDWQSQAFWSDGGDPDGDREEDDPSEPGGDDEETLGWSANVSQLALGRNTVDGDLTAPEQHGMGFVRCGADEAEDKDDDDDGRWPWPDGAPDELIGVHAHV